MRDVHSYISQLGNSEGSAGRNKNRANSEVGFRIDVHFNFLRLPAIMKRNRSSDIDKNSVANLVVKDDLDRDPWPHPMCRHGPTVLFERNWRKTNQSRRFFACSTNRERNGCDFFSWEDEKLTDTKREVWRQKLENFVNSAQEAFEQQWRNFKNMQLKSNISFCITCESLLERHDAKHHDGHDIIDEVTKDQLKSPTQLLNPLNASKREAQYHFTDGSLKTIVDNIVNSGAKAVLCIGAPSVFEAIRRLHPTIQTLMLDIDVRLGKFFEPGQDWCWYNMFNHHFFIPEHQKRYLNFVTATKDLAIVTDPPFGGKCDLIASSLRKVARDCQRIPSPKLLWIFPYFMEHKIMEELPEMRMSDYQVNYRNHSSFKDGGRKQGSPVRIFTNISLENLRLPSEEGYKFCKSCKLWVCKDNRHCKWCQSCTSKNGGTYNHCKKCRKCVKATWSHCDKCGRCALTDHPCELFKAKKVKTHQV